MAQGFVGSGREPTGGSGEMWEKEGQGWASESMLLSGFPNRVECSHHRVPLVAVCLLELVAVAARVASAAQYSGTQRSVLSTQYSDSVLRLSTQTQYSVFDGVRHGPNWLFPNMNGTCSIISKNGMFLTRVSGSRFLLHPTRAYVATLTLPAFTPNF